MAAARLVHAQCGSAAQQILTDVDHHSPVLAKATVHSAL